MYAHYRLCPKCTFILLYTTLNLKAYKINYRKKCVTFLRGGWGSRNVHMTFLVDKIDMWRFPWNASCFLRNIHATSTNVCRESGSFVFWQHRSSLKTSIIRKHCFIIDTCLKPWMFIFWSKGLVDGPCGLAVFNFTVPMKRNFVQYSLDCIAKIIEITIEFLWQNFCNCVLCRDVYGMQMTQQCVTSHCIMTFEETSFI